MSVVSCRSMQYVIDAWQVDAGEPVASSLRLHGSPALLAAAELAKSALACSLLIGLIRARGMQSGYVLQRVASQSQEAG
jgi:hypothetical protein